MDFPDQPYLERILAALWRRGFHGNAAVMVGSGFSLNARPRSASSGSFPTWAVLAEKVVDHLYPPHGGSGHRNRALEEATATSGFLRLAQEYETAFGREALERLIGEAVPDRQFEPSELHDILLELPWADVFTTNWDTLLERTADRVIDRKYDVVRAISDIPASMKPRIVKLHGTLNTNRPFVFTEEDFRRYPVRQAPFVNLAQQAMMENVFCLLGFSGEDPNFLYWSGWVRDHLAKYAPQIYLVGWLDLSPPRRRMLEERGVIPIDCARLPSASSWPEGMRHRYACEWFLWTLKAREPYRLTNWPNVRSRQRQSIPNYLSIAFNQVQEPQKEPQPNSPATVQELRELLRAWRHNRSLYPGWLIAPHAKRLSIWMRTQYWISPILALLPELLEAEKLECLEELNWRFELCLVPLTEGLSEAFEMVLDSAGVLASNLVGAPASNRQNRDELRFRWINLATALLRSAREENNSADFNRWSADLLACSPILPELRSRLHYERCLLALTQFDYQALEREIAQWNEIEVDSFWKVRRAGMLIESGKAGEAFQAVREALIEIRRQTRNDVVDVPSLSREGWAMFLAQGFHVYPLGNVEFDENESPRVQRGIEPMERSEKRSEVLRLHECDARKRIDECWQMLQGEIPRKAEPAQRVILGFDPGRSTRIGQLLWPNTSGIKFLPAFQVKRLIEEVGLPPVAYHTDLAKSLLLRAAEWLSQPDPKGSLGLVLRTGDRKRGGTFDSFLTRNRIAVLDNERVFNLAEQVEKSLDHGIAKATAAVAERDVDRRLYWMQRLEVAIELLSRLVPRLEADRVESILQRAIGYYRDPIFWAHHWLIEPLANLFLRSLNTLGVDRVQKYLGTLISLQIPGEQGFEPGDYERWPDPFWLVRDFGFAGREWLDPAQIRRLIELVRQSPQPYPRAIAVRRLIILINWHLLSEDDMSELGEALWTHRIVGGFPEGVDLYDFAFLDLPEPEAGLAVDLFRKRYLQAPPKRLSEIYLLNIAGAASSSTGQHTSLQFSVTEAEQIAEAILTWWRGEGIPALEGEKLQSNVFHKEDFKEALVGALAEAVLPNLRLDSPLIPDIASMVEDLRTACFPVERLYPVLTRLLPDGLSFYADRLRQSLASNSQRTAEGAVVAVWWWLQCGRDSRLSQPPVDLVREIALAISLRRASCLKVSLSAAEWILLNEAAFVEARFIDLIAEGLGYLLEQTRYATLLWDVADSDFAAEETSLIRVRCVKVAAAAIHVGGEDRPIFQEWIRQAETDPLPEVRFALS